jgi:hypothetical protein
MLGDDPLDAGAVAASIVRSAARPMDWLEQAYRLQRLADELIERWHEATRIGFEAQADHYRRFPVEWRFELDLKPGDIVPIRPGERESELRLRAVRGLVAHGSPEVYMMLAGQAVENLVKGPLRPRASRGRPVSRASCQRWLGACPACEQPRHAPPDGAGSAGDQPQREGAKHRSAARAGGPLARSLSDPDDGRPGKSGSAGRPRGVQETWLLVVTFRGHVDALYARFFAELVEPAWFPYWEPDKFPSY